LPSQAISRFFGFFTRLAEAAGNDDAAAVSSLVPNLLDRLIDLLTAQER